MRVLVDTDEPSMIGNDQKNGLQVLVVEDNAVSAESLAILLRLQGHQVQVALDGPSGLQVAQDCQPDVVLLDLG